MRRLTTIVLFSGVVGVLLGGCARSVEVVRRDPGLPVGATGRGAEVVFAGAMVADGVEGWEFGRRDVSLTARDAYAWGVDAGWEAPERPNLSNARRLHLDRERPDSVIYFERGSRGRWEPGWR